MIPKFVKENKGHIHSMMIDKMEADDLIAGFIQLHPEANHVIISSDSDFQQLISENVSQYNGIADIHITHEGYFDAKGKRIIDNKTQEPKRGKVEITHKQEDGTGFSEYEEIK